MRKRRRERFTLGICLDCPAPRVNGLRCRACADKCLSRQHAMKQRRMARNLCVACGQHRKRPNRTLCEDCTEICISNHRDAIRALVAAGLCITCKAPATRGQRCDPCADANIARTLKGRAKRIAAGLCSTCGKVQARPSRRTCQTCAEHRADREWVKKRRQQPIEAPSLRSHSSLMS